MYNYKNPFQIIFIWGYIGEAIFDWDWILMCQDSVDYFSFSWITWFLLLSSRQNAYQRAFPIPHYDFSLELKLSAGIQGTF